MTDIDFAKCGELIERVAKKHNDARLFREAGFAREGGYESQKLSWKEYYPLSCDERLDVSAAWSLADALGTACRANSRTHSTIVNSYYESVHRLVKDLELCIDVTSTD